MHRLWAVLFTVVMLLSAGSTAYFSIRQYTLSEQLAETALSLETNQGRERKQTAEYDEVQSKLPEIQEKMAMIQPQADSTSAEVTALKAERKTLRAEKNTLTAEMSDLQATAGTLQNEQAALLAQLMKADARKIAGALAEVMP